MCVCATPNRNACKPPWPSTWTRGFTDSVSAGVFNTVDPQLQKRERSRRWGEQQKFFESTRPDVTRKRKLHIYYCVSLFIMDAANPGV